MVNEKDHIYNMSSIEKKNLRHTYWLETIADVRLELDDPIDLGAYRVLARIPGMKFKYPAYFKDGIASGESLHLPNIGEYVDIEEGRKDLNTIEFDYRSPGREEKFDLKKPVSKARILSNIMKAINEAQSSFRENGRVLLIIYISSHGRLGDDGQPYILPYDAIAEDFRSWISYKEIIELVREFLKNGGQQELNKHAIVILDSCQTKPLSKALLPAVELPIPPGMTLVQSVSPGQYAWHWTAKSVETGNVEVVEEHRWGFPRPPSKQADGQFQRSPTARMSVLPISSTCAMNVAPKYVDEEKRPRPISISTYDWLESMKFFADEFLNGIPDMQDAGLSQNINVQYGSLVDQWLPIFLVLPRGTNINDVNP